MSDDGGNAFPQSAVYDGNRDEVNLVGAYFDAGGMSLRDYFAAKAMHVHLQQIRSCDFQGKWAEKIAFASYRIADAMLKARKE